MRGLAFGALVSPQVAAVLKPYTAPRTRSVVAPGGRLMPSRAHGVEALTEGVDGQAGMTLWSPFLSCSVDPLGPRMSSGPQAGKPTRDGIGTAFDTPRAGWNLSGIATGWSRPGAPTPARQPTTALAIGRGWGPFTGGQAPLPTLPEPARMVAPWLR